MFMAHVACSKRAFSNRDTHITEEIQQLLGFADLAPQRFLKVVEFPQ